MGRILRVKQKEILVRRDARTHGNWQDMRQKYLNTTAAIMNYPTNNMKLQSLKCKIFRNLTGPVEKSFCTYGTIIVLTYDTSF